MRDRVAYTSFEARVIELYEKGKLRVTLLDKLARRYCHVEMDSAGSQYLLTQDGQDLQQLCIGIIDPLFPLVFRGCADDHEEYWERELQKWTEITRQRWGWR
jgi:hypothetical protein